MKHKKRIIMVTALILGMALLVGSAFANYGNANGYAVYKEAIKKMLYQTNYSADVEMILSYDDKVMAKATWQAQYNDEADITQSLVNTECTYAYDGTELYGYGKKEFYTSDTRYIRTNDYRGDEGVWRAYRTNRSGNEIYETFNDNETANKAITFVELLADVFVGDLKNNFALVNSDEENDYYEVNLTGNQIPEFVNAGLALIFTAENNSTASYVTYEDGGYEFHEKVWESAEKLRQEKGGIVVVESDGSLTHYATYEEYRLAMFDKKPDSELDFDDLLYCMGKEPTIGKATSHFAIDEEGRLTQNTLVGTMVGTDKEGNEHTFAITINISLYDYENTTPKALADMDTIEIVDDDYYYGYEEQVTVEEITTDTESITADTTVTE